MNPADFPDAESLAASVQAAIEAAAASILPADPVFGRSFADLQGRDQAVQQHPVAGPGNRRLIGAGGTVKPAGLQRLLDQFVHSGNRYLTLMLPVQPVEPCRIKQEAGDQRGSRFDRGAGIKHRTGAAGKVFRGLAVLVCLRAEQTEHPIRNRQILHR